MADRLLAAEEAFPGFTGEETQEEKLRRVLDYVSQLREQYRYVLSLLDREEDG